MELQHLFTKQLNSLWMAEVQNPLQANKHHIISWINCRWNAWKQEKKTFIADRYWHPSGYKRKKNIDKDYKRVGFYSGYFLKDYINTFDPRNFITLEKRDFKHKKEILAPYITLLLTPLFHSKNRSLIYSTKWPPKKFSKIYKNRVIDQFLLQVSKDRVRWGEVLQSARMNSGAKSASCSN